MSLGGHTIHVAVVTVLLVVAAAPGAAAVGGGATDALDSTTASMTTTSTDRPANATVKFGYVNGSNSHVTLVTANGSEIDTGVTGVVVGKGADMDGDGYVEVPYVTSQQTLHVIDRTGESVQLADTAEEQGTMAIADLDGDGTMAVYYGRHTSTGGEELRRAYYNGTTEVVASKDTATNAVAGVDDITGDGVKEVVFVGSSTDLRYYNESAGTVVTFYSSGIGTNSGYGVGSPRDFDGDGVAEVPMVDGSNNGVLVDADGSTTTVVSGGVDKSPVAGVELDVANGTEFVFAAGNDLQYATLSGDIHTLKDASGNNFATTDAAGVSWVETNDEPLTVEAFSLTNDSGNLTLAVQLSEEAESLDVDVSGPESRSFGLSDFSATESGGSWNYTVTWRPSEDGNYTANFDSARSVDDDETHADVTDDATVDVRYDAYDLHASGDADGNLTISFESTEPLGDASVSVSGAENFSLDGSNFSTGDSSAPYTYTATEQNLSRGNYTVTVNSATSHDGQVDDETMTDDATVSTFDVYNLTLNATASGNLSASFDATEAVQSAGLTLSGPGNATVAFEDFSETGTDPYRYETTVNASEDGNWTITLDSATATDGTTDSPGLTADATLDARSPTLVNATLTDATDGNGAVNASDRVTVTATVSGDVETVTADLSAFGDGTLELPQVDDDTYRTTVAVDDASDGRHSVPVTAKDGQGNEDTATTNAVTVDNVPPNASLGDDRTVTEGTTVEFVADASDERSGVATTRWDAPDGTTRNTTSHNATFDAPGEYVVRFAATDAAGNTGSAVVNVTVEETTSTETTTTETATATDTETATETPTESPVETATATATGTPSATETGTEGTTATDRGSTGTDSSNDRTAAAANSPTEVVTEPAPTETAAGSAADEPSKAEAPGFGPLAGLFSFLLATVVALRRV